MVRQNRLFYPCLVFFWSVGFFSCTDSDTTPAPSTAGGPYFSLEDFFLNETSRLTSQALTVDKTVSRNSMSETKRVQISDWKNELALFIDSDINKPAWRGSYRIDSTGYSVAYSSIDPELRTQKITIEKQGDGKVKHIAIINHTGNMLYQTDEQLDYYPDSLYQINKQQRVRFLGDSRYSISGLLQ